MAVRHFPSACNPAILAGASCLDTPAFCTVQLPTRLMFSIDAAHAAMQIRPNQIHNTPNMSVQRVFTSPLLGPAHCVQLANRGQLGGLIFLCVCASVCFVSLPSFCSGCVCWGGKIARSKWKSNHYSSARRRKVEWSHKAEMPRASLAHVGADLFGEAAPRSSFGLLEPSGCAEILV